MSFKQGVLIIALLAASETTIISCTDRNEEQQTLTIVTKTTPTQPLSPYDQIMKQYAGENDLDWRFLSAICYHESRFRNNLTSRVGAVGVMQIMPSVARQFGVSVQQARDPEVNIHLAVRVIKKIEESITFLDQTPERDRLEIILACYNAGVGHVKDAYRLAQKHGAEPTSWATVEEYLRLKSQPSFLGDPAVRCGRLNSNETSKFVRVVMEQYGKYCREYPA